MSQNKTKQVVSRIGKLEELEYFQDILDEPVDIFLVNHASPEVFEEILKTGDYGARLFEDCNNPVGLSAYYVCLLKGKSEHVKVFEEFFNGSNYWFNCQSSSFLVYVFSSHKQI